MLKYLIGSLRKKPLSFRQNVAFWSAATFTAAVVAVWAYHLPARHNQMAVVDQSENEEEPRGITGVFDIISDEFTSMQASVADSDESSSTSVRAEQSLQRAVDQARASSTAQLASSTQNRWSTTSPATTSSQTIASSTDIDQGTTTTESDTPQPRPVRIITTTASPSATSTE